MGSGRLVAFGCVLLACVGLGDGGVLSVVVPTYWGVEAQGPAAAGTEREHSRVSADRAGRLWANTQTAAGLLSWRFPEDPVDPVQKYPVMFQQRQPTKNDRMAVRCGEDKIQVEVKQDLLGGRLIKPKELTLGGCSATEVDLRARVIAFESELQGCGSELVV